MEYKFINLTKQDNGIVTIELNRPEKKNAWNEAMREEMRHSFRSVMYDDATRVIIVRGAGDAFAPGEDVGEMIERRDEQWTTRDFRRMAINIHNLFDEIESCEIPVIAAIDGICVCGGLELALSCDIRIASDRSRFGLIEGNVGFIPGSGGCSRLVKVAGLGVTKDFILSGDIIDAHEAKQRNIINRVVSVDSFEEEVQALALKLAKKAPLTLGMAKHVINLCADSNFNSSREFERLGQSILMMTEDHYAAAAGFLAKNLPQVEFKGR
ncbi:enoyl-CoA hydratase/isomerase family protein [Paenibacillus xerothermodurans]|uniref:Enoyl-CoA hydratase/isomerase family protein n=1 Tax=Paenibacillus xerothermodurans TaxID=1977292 RepID=A0A2W1NCK7_PAEXE|nr:enoyl-CoA hydratase/isomerase family protein [Paenibacillus xerothermodurans]PZE21390.1 enoyl-CoA hydratase/isomerase family protein [Paenibacillus xerothermodurans]